MTNKFEALDDIERHIVRAKKMAALCTPQNDEERAKLQVIEDDIALLEAERDRRANAQAEAEASDQRQAIENYLLGRSSTGLPG